MMAGVGPPVLFGTLLVSLGVYALRLGTADLIMLPARAVLEESLGQSQGTDQDRWNAILAALQAAQHLDPWNPQILADLGRATEESAARFRPWEEAAGRKRRRALEYYRRAAVLRPTWPYTWVNIAQAKLSLAEIDQEFREALGRAADLGPWEPEVQLTVGELGLATWHLLPPETRRIITVSLKKGLRLKPQQLIRAAFDLDRQNILQLLGQSDPAVAEMFRKEQARRTSALPGRKDKAPGGSRLRDPPVT
jgi:hypothetical protein